MPRGNRNFGHPYGSGFYGFPEAAFSDPSGDKPTTKVIELDIYEVWRDLLVCICINMSNLGFAWWAKVSGMPSMYNTLCLFAIFVAIGCFFWWLITFMNIKDTKISVPTASARVKYRLFCVWLGFIIAFALHYFFFS